MSAWRILVGDRFGNTLTNVSPIAVGRQYVGALNRPAMFTFKVPASDTRVAGLHTDGLPFVGEGRSVRAYRREAQQDGSTAWVVRFTGYMWQVTDEGNDADQWTTCVCFDPLQLLNRRVARAMVWVIPGGEPAGKFSWSDSPAYTGNPYGGDYLANFLAFDLLDVTGGVAGPYTLATKSGTEVARGLLNATNQYDGYTGIQDYYINGNDAPYLGWVDDGTARSVTAGEYERLRSGQAFPTGETAPPASAAVSPSYDHKRVGEAIIDLTAGYNGFDLEIVPLPATVMKEGRLLYGSAREYPYDYLFGTSRIAIWRWYRPLAQLRFYTPRGVTLPNVTFAWGVGPHSAKAIKRTTDLEQLVNNGYAAGASGYKQSLNLPSIAQYGAAQDYQSYTDVTDPAQLASLSAEAVLLGGIGAPVYTITPMPGRSPLPWDNFNLGDTVTVAAGPRLRGGFSALHRVYGFTLDIADDSSAEVLSSVTTSLAV